MNTLPPHPPNPNTTRWIRRILFIASAALAAAALRITWQKPLYGALFLTIIALIFTARWLSRARLKKALRQGDIETILRRWAHNLDQIPHAETMAPLLSATAFTAYGRVEQAKAALAAAERGPAWDAALEHRLFIGTLISIFEGEHEESLKQAQKLQSLPIPKDASALLQTRIKLLRKSLLALARAFAHQSLPGDRDLLEYASETSPLVFWAMRYGAAVVAIDEGSSDKARELLNGAPPWPEESTFRAFHDEIVHKLSETA